MNIKKILKCLVIFFGAFFLLWSIFIGLVATPEVLTPRVESILQQHVKSVASVRSVDLSLFDDFPNLTLQIDSLRIAQTKDSINDLVFARQCKIAVNPFALIFKHLKINNISLTNANIHIYVDSLNGPLKTFNLPEQEAETEADSTSMDLSGYKLSLKKFKIDSAQIVVDDRVSKFYTRVENFNTDMSMNLSSTVSDVDLSTGFSNIIVWHKGDLLAKKTSMQLQSVVNIDRDSMLISFEQARLKVNKINLRTRGNIRRDTINKGFAVDIKSRLNTSSLTEFLDLIPSSIIDNKEEISTQGAVAFNVDVKGVYSDNSFPTLEATLKVDDAKAKYASRKLALEGVDCDAYMFLNLNKPKESYADIKSFHINTSEIIDVNASGRVNNIIENPAVDIALDANIDFDRFTEVFPLNEGIVCSGKSQSNIKTQFMLSDIQMNNYARLYINGETTFNDLELSFDASKFARDSSSVSYMRIQTDHGSMVFGDNLLANNNSRTLRSKINFQNLEYKAKSGEYLSVQDIDLTVGANFNRKTSQMNGVGFRGMANNMVVGVDTLFNASLESSDLSFSISPKTEERETTITANISSNKISAKEHTFNSNLELSSAKLDLSMQRIKVKEWDINGTVDFNEFGMFTNLFPMDIAIPNTSVSVVNRTIQLNNAKMTIGSSTLYATGKVTNLIRKIFVEPRATLSGDLVIRSPYLDFSELVEASNRSSLMMTQLAEAPDSLAVQQEQVTDAESDNLFIVPRGLDFVFDMNIDKAIFEDSEIKDLEGRATLSKGVLSLDKLSVAAIGAEAKGSMKYQNIGIDRANIAADMNLAEVDIDRIGELIPSINSMLPMLETFKGVVDFDIKANANIGKGYELELPTLYSSMRFKGRDLVLMDNETFKDISKMLLFKNKKRNIVDSLEVHALVAESRVDVLPFLMSIDRYTTVIGGYQNVDIETFDVDYNYHVSVIKSPLPFKAGVDISGNLEDFKYKLTKAKLSKTNFNEQRRIYEEYSNTINDASDKEISELNARLKALQSMRRMQIKSQQESEQEAALGEPEIDTTFIHNGQIKILDSVSEIKSDSTMQKIGGDTTAAPIIQTSLKSNTKLKIQGLNNTTIKTIKH